MKKLVTFRFDPELLKKIKGAAEAENRTLTNYVETTLKKALAPEEPGDAPGLETQADRAH